MSLCEAHQEIKVGDFVTKNGSLKLIHVDRIERAVQRTGLCHGIEGWKISGHDAAGNWELVDPCSWSPVPDPVAFIRGQGQFAQAEFITKHPEVWPALAEQLVPYVAWVHRVMLPSDYEKQLQAKRVGYWEEDFQQHIRHRKPPFNLNF